MKNHYIGYAYPIKEKKEHIITILMRKLRANPYIDFALSVLSMVAIIWLLSAAAGI